MNFFRTLAMVGLVGVGMVDSVVCKEANNTASNQPSTPQISYECFVIASDSPIQHDFSKLTNRREVFIFTFNKIVTRLGKEIIFKGSPSPSKEYVIGITNPITIRAGISITLTGTLDQGKITLLGKINSTETDTPKSSLDSFTLEARSSDLYFSTKTQSNGEVWFDMDRMLLKIPLMGEHSSYRYHTIRIVPTLTQ